MKRAELSRVVSLCTRGPQSHQGPGAAVSHESKLVTLRRPGAPPAGRAEAATCPSAGSPTRPGRGWDTRGQRRRSINMPLWGCWRGGGPSRKVEPRRRRASGDLLEGLRWPPGAGSASPRVTAIARWRPPWPPPTCGTGQHLSSRPCPRLWSQNGQVAGLDHCRPKAGSPSPSCFHVRPKAQSAESPGHSPGHSPGR